MAKKENLLEQRKRVKSKKPNFRRHDSHKKSKLAKSWRKPRGLQNKLRLNKRGYGSQVTTGWGSPKEVRGLHPSGLETVLVHNVSELGKVDPKTQGAIIGSKVGKRKKVEIIKEAQTRSIKILNLDPEKYLEKVNKMLKEQKEEQKEREERKQEREEEAKKKEKEAEKEEEAPEDLKEHQKKEKEQMEKVITKK